MARDVGYVERIAVGDLESRIVLGASVPVGATVFFFFATELRRPVLGLGLGMAATIVFGVLVLYKMAPG